jgi:ApeA N-terminal domain 1
MREVRLELDDDMKTGIDWMSYWNDPDAQLPLVRVFGENAFRVSTPITLDRCFFTRDENRLTANVAVVGTRFSTGSEISFREIRFRLSHLDAWCQRKGFGYDRKWHTEDALRFAIQWTKPPSCVAHLPDGTRIEIVTHLNEGSWGPSRTTAHLSEMSEIRVLFPKRMDIAEIRRVVYVLRNLIALGVGSGVRMESMSAYRVVPRSESERYFVHNEIIYPLVEPPVEADEDEPNPLRMPFLLDHIADRFDEHINRWFEAVERLGPVTDMYFSLLHSPPTFPETRFLSHMQALEGYHRRTFPDDVQWTDKDWSRIKKQLLTGLDPAVASAFGDKRLEILNSFSLSARLSKLMRLCPKTSKRILQAGRTTKGAYLDCAQATRNDQAHLLVPRPSKAAKGNDLFRVEAQSLALLEALLLVDVGFEDSDIGEMLWRSQRLDRIRLWA